MFDVQVLRRALAAGGPTALRRTHTAWVVLAGDRAYKGKLDVRFDFVDLSTPELRRAACRHEAELNDALAPGLVLGVRGITADGTLTDDDAPDAVQTCVVMRRFDEDATLAAHIARGTATEEQARAVGARIAAFHAGARRVRPAPNLREVVDRNFDGLDVAAHGTVDPVLLRALRRFADAFADAWAAEVAARGERGLVIDGHGDLRAEHVVLEDGGVTIVDRLEIDPLRIVDVADDLAFLVMDLEHLGRPDLARAAQEGYGDHAPAPLVAAFAAYRAEVRAKVALLRAQAAGQDADAARADALAHLALARRLGWRARGPLRILVTGPPASGKTTLARAIADASGLPVLSSDAVRKADDAHPAYDLAARAAVYTALGREAAARPALIVDATFGDPAFHRAFLDACPGCDPVVVELEVDDATRARRAGHRDAGDLSDADPRVAARLAAAFVGMPARRRLVLQASASPTALVDAIESFLDARVSGPS